MIEKPLKITGRIRMVPIPNIDTDMIFHNRHLHITERDKMAEHIFGNLEGWQNYPKESQTGDILIVGHNFGCGSSRQQAVDGFLALGVVAVIGESFGAIYKRNAINAGWPLVECPGIIQSGIKDLDQIQINLETGSISTTDGIEVAKGKPLSRVQRDIYQAEGLMELAHQEDK